MNKLPETLLVALKDLWHLVDVLAAHEPVLDTKSSYYTLFAHCFHLHRNILDHRQIHQHRDLIQQILSYLEGVVINIANIPECKAADRLGSRHPGLETFHDFMVSDGFEERQKLKLMKKSLNLTRTDEFEALEAILVAANHRLLNDRGWKQDDLRIQRNPKQRPPDHILPAAGSLFKVLDSKRRCTCEPSHQYIVQLCLQTHLAKIDDCNFDLFLGLGKSWQEAKIQSVTSLKGLGATREREMKRKVERLCADIIKIRKTLPDYGLRFRIEEECLWKLQSERSSIKMDPSKAPVTLAQFIAEMSNLLNEKTKRVLSVLLSYAIYHLIGTPWLQSWGSSNITFFRSNTGLPLRPYIETHLDKDMIDNIGEPSLANEEEDFDPDDALRPPYPCLVDLAVVLLELYKATLFDDLADLHGVYKPDVSDMVMARYGTFSHEKSLNTAHRT